MFALPAILNQSEPQIIEDLLYLKFDSPNFTLDSSPSPKTLIFQGAQAVANITDKKYGTSSLFDSYNFSHDRSLIYQLSLPSIFTVEFWHKPPSSFTHESYVFSSTNGTTNGRFFVNIRSNSMTNPGYRLYVGGSTGLYVPCNYDSWQHFAVCADGTNFHCYLNGIFRTTLTPSWGGNPSKILDGTQYKISNSGYFGHKGYVDSLRVSSGMRYTANFNPETDTGLAY